MANATMPPGGGGPGERAVTAVFDGANQSETVLTALQQAGFHPQQVTADVYDAHGATGAGAATGAWPQVALALGLVLGALLGAILGRLLVGSTLALVLGAVAGAVAGAAIAGAIARAASARPSAGDATRRRPGSVTLTVAAESEAQAGEARAIFARHGGQETPSLVTRS